MKKKNCFKLIKFFNSSKENRILTRFSKIVPGQVPNLINFPPIRKIMINVLTEFLRSSEIKFRSLFTLCHLSKTCVVLQRIMIPNHLNKEASVFVQVADFKFVYIIICPKRVCSYKLFQTIILNFLKFPTGDQFMLFGQEQNYIYRKISRKTKQREYHVFLTMSPKKMMTVGVEKLDI